MRLVGPESYGFNPGVNPKSIEKSNQAVWSQVRVPAACDNCELTCVNCFMSRVAQKKNTGMTVTLT